MNGMTLVLQSLKTPGPSPQRLAPALLAFVRRADWTRASEPQQNSYI